MGPVGLVSSTRAGATECPRRWTRVIAPAVRGRSLPPSPNMLLRIRLVPLALLVLLLLHGCRWPWESEAPAALMLSGTVDAHEVDLAFQVGGRIARLLADEGSTVQVGQTLAELDATDLQLAAERARAQA